VSPSFTSAQYVHGTILPQLSQAANGKEKASAATTSNRTPQGKKSLRAGELPPARSDILVV